MRNEEPLIPASENLPEITIKAVILSILLAALLAASNAYLALKIGSTIAASIPASVLALGILRLFPRHNVLESNIAQTAASAGEGIAAAVSYVMPALIILHVWSYFPYWETATITILGGVLGVLFSIPLRRILLNMEVLRFPEGVAIGNVLRASTGKGNYLALLVQGGIAGGLLSFAQTGLKIVANNIQLWFVSGRIVLGTGLSFTPAMLAAGYIIGLEASFSLLVGSILGWTLVLSYLGWHYGVPDAASAYQAALILWSKYLRYVGVGMMLVGGLWTMLRLLKPVVRGLKLSLATLSIPADDRIPIPRTERDIPIIWVFFGTIVISLLLYMLVLHSSVEVKLLFSNSTILFIAFITVIFILVVGFVLATICGYFTGLVGASNNPLSGMLIISIVLLGLLYLLIFDVSSIGKAMKLTALVIIITVIVASIASISLENIQDLKAGQMVGATPWKQQTMLLVGVVVSALVIAPVLDLLFNAYGIGGVFPHPGMDPSQMLAAPQSGLMAAVAQGVLLRHLPWNMIIIGGVLAIFIIIVNVYLQKRNLSMPAMAVGLGIYLPPSIILPIVVGSVVSHFAKHQDHEKRQRGVLLASGVVAGSALTGVILAIPFVLAGNSSVLAIVGAGFKVYAMILGVLSVFGLCYWLYAVGEK